MCVYNQWPYHTYKKYICVCVCVYIINDYLYIRSTYMCICMISNISLLNDDWRLTTDDSIHSQRLRVLKAFSPSPVDNLLRTNGVYGQSEITPSLHHSTHCRSRSIFILGIHQDKRWPGSKGARGQGAKVITDQRIHRLT